MFGFSLRTLCLATALLLWALPLQAQPGGPSYQIPCQERSAFVSRVRSLVRSPDTVEIALTRFSVVVSQEPSAWLLTVVRTDAEPEEPRTVRDASCEAVAEAAALVVAAWIEQAPLAWPQDVTAPNAAESDTANGEPPPANGIALGIDSASAIAPHWSVGGSLQLWHMQRGDVFLHTLDLTAWPTSFRLQPPTLGTDYDRPVFEVGYTFGIYFIRLGRVSTGFAAGIRLGIRPQDTSYTSVFRASLQVPVRVNLSGPWDLYIRPGVSDGTNSESDTTISFDLSVALSVKLF